MKKKESNGSNGICISLNEFRNQVSEYITVSGELNDSAFRHVKADSINDDNFAGIFDYESSDHICHRHILKVAKVMQMMSFPSTLKDFVFRESMRNYLISGSGTFTRATIPNGIMGEYVNSILFRSSKIGNSYKHELSPEGLMRYSLTEKEYDGTRECAFRDGRIYAFYNDETLLINRMGYKDFAEFRKAIIYTEGLRRNCGENIVYAPISASLMNVQRMVRILIDRNHFTLLHGRAGCGKTTAAIHKVPASARVAVISLANNIANATAAKLHKSGIKADPVSNTAASIKFQKRDGEYICSYDFIMIDEFSQYSLYEIRLLENILEYAVETKSPVVIMGDEYQIPSFLGRGSLLNSFLIEFHYQCEALTENHRSGDMGIVKLCDEFLSNETLEPVIQSAYLCNHNDLIAELKSGKYADTMFVTGSHSSIRLIKYICCSSLMGIPLVTADFFSSSGEPVKQETEPNDFLSLHEQDTLVFLRKGGKLRVRTNEKLTANSCGKPIIIHRNSAFIMQISMKALPNETNPIMNLTGLDAEGKTVEVPYSKVKLYFTPDYAMTVNTAQGLEWDHVYVVMGNLPYTLDDGQRITNPTCNMNLYEREESVYVSLSRAKQTLHVYMGDCPDKKYSRVPVINLFSEAI